MIFDGKYYGENFSTREKEYTFNISIYATSTLHRAQCGIREDYIIFLYIIAP